MLTPARPAEDRSLRTVDLPEGAVARLAPLFQQGVQVRAPAGISLRDFLVVRLGVDPEYVRTRVSTVFLDGSVVDDLEAARLHEGSRLALSAAMPGLVGATLRKGGFYAAMRAAITLAAERGAADDDGAMVGVRVKLFNLLIEELGPVLLAHGVALPRAEAEALLGGPPAETPAGAADAPEVWLRAVAR
jgi:hypothetical protein